MKPLIPKRLRLAHEREAIKDNPEPTGLIFHFVVSHSVFLALTPCVAGTWSSGYTSVTIIPSEAVKLELFIAEKTAPIINALAATSDTKGFNLVSYGRKYYEDSGSIIGALYHEDGTRSDWGKVNVALEEGESVNIRPATKAEHAAMAVQCAQAIKSAKADGWSGPWDAKKGVRK